MTLPQPKSVSRSSNANAVKILPYIKDTGSRHQIRSAVRQRCFPEQISHESGSLFYTEEPASGTTYAFILSSPFIAII